jgi:hypothetical protein
MSDANVFERPTRLGKRTIKPVSEGYAVTSVSSSPRAAAATEIASYIAQMTAEMGQMAAAAKLEMLAYFLAMARVEAEMIARRDAHN